ncbi:MAG: Hsp20/alpha crystallin family protein [Vicinamibacterales bacterium]
MLSLTRWNPVDEFARMERDLDRWFADMTGATAFPNLFSQSNHLPMQQVTAGKDGWHVRVPLPGVAPDKVSVNVSGRTLQIRVADRDGDTQAVLYEQRFTLPDGVDAERIAGMFTHGLLEIALPYQEALKARAIPIATGEQKQIPAS